MNDYYNESFDYVNSFHPMPEPIFKQMYDFSVLKKIAPDTIILEMGEVPKKVYLITEGVLRAYLTLPNGKEITKTIFTPMMFFTPINALVRKNPTIYAYHTVTECMIFEVDYTSFYKLKIKNIDVMTLYSKAVELLLHREEMKCIEILSLDARERYLSLRKRIPDIDNLMPQYQIASYLGVSPVQLSRIRSKLSNT